MRTRQLLPLGVLFLGLIPACGDDGGKNQPNPPAAGAGGSAGSGGTGKGGDQAAAGKPPTAGQGGSGGSQAPAGGEGGAEEAGSGAGGDPNPVDCSKLSAIPAKFETLEGFTSSEDFAFDALGNYVGVDSDQNLVRISKDGKKELWAPAMGSVAGMGMLPDGSVVIADVGNGAVKRVYPNGASTVVLGGLLYPNGLDIGPDGFIYVAENDAGRVRRINPDNGEFTIVAMGLFGPNGVAFSNDPKLLYIGSFEGSGVYRVEIAEPGTLGVSTVLARPNGSDLPEPKLACPDQVVGKECKTTTRDIEGTCQQLSNVVDCVPENPCADAEEGEQCTDPFGLPGQCTDGYCVSKNVCEGKPDGTECEDFGFEGECNDGYCQPINVCTGKPDGTKCEDFGFEGECSDGYCQPINPCKGKSAGDACTSDFGSGTCEGVPGELYCEPPNPCESKPDGQECTSVFSGPGKCQDEQCVPEGGCEGDECVTQCTQETLGQPCVGPGGPGTCVADEDDFICQPSDPGGGPGGIDGLGVDACGNVYASEFQQGNVWRISPDGKVELLAKLPSSWVPNIKWGRGVGGFSSEVMYVADRDTGRLFGVSVGVPGVTEFYDRQVP